jgi:hypothetical protein
MSQRWYLNGAGKHFTQGDINFPSDNIKAALVTSAYTPDTSAAGDEFLSTISGLAGAIVSRSGNLASKTNVGGVLGCANFTVTLVPTGHVIKYVVFYKDTGVDATSILLLIDDTGQNLPTTTNGADLQYQVSTGPNKLGAICSAT